MKLYSYRNIRFLMNNFRNNNFREVFPDHNSLSLEHIVPKSYVGKKNVYCKDMHNIILLPCKLNSQRSNYRYISKDEIEIYDNNIYLDENGNKCNFYNETVSIKNSKKRLFVPADLEKGMIARSIAYSIDNYNYIFLLDKLLSKNNLIEWHMKFPVNDYEYEKHRMVFEKQNNINKFILCDKLIKYF